MNQFKINFMIFCFLIVATTVSSGQSYKESDKPCHRIRLGIKTLIPNLAGGTGEFVLPVANNRLSLVADYTRLGIPQAVATALEMDSSVKATLSYLAVGPNFYLGNKGRGGGAYLGLRYQQITAKTSIVGEESFTGEGNQKAVAFLFGVSSGGHFWTGLEIGAGKPLGNATGSSVEVVNGKSTRTYYSESLISVIPIFNFKIGVSF